MPCDESLPIEASVSDTHPGLTTFTRILPCSSSAATRANPSMPALTILDRAAADHRLLRERAACERDGTACLDMSDTAAHEIDLAHELVGKAECVIVIPERIERPKLRRAADAHDRADLPQLAVHRGDARLVRQIHRHIRALAARGDDLIAVLKNPRDLRVQQTLSTDDQHSHMTSFRFDVAGPRPLRRGIDKHERSSYCRHSLLAGSVMR